MYTKDEFVRRAKLTHGDKYDYDKVIYLGSRKKVEIVCRIHGSFLQEPSSHLRGYGCPMCNPHHKSNRDEFVKRASLKHNGKYDYSSVEYIDAFTKVKIICPYHGVFKQNPAQHLSGQGCPKCKGDATSKRMRKSSDVFFTQMREIYGDEYDFSKSEYKGNHEKLVFICKKHGEMARTPHELLEGKGCPVCLPNMMLNTRTFIIKAKEIHGDLYDYSKVKYVDTHTKVCITCQTHGDFWQSPHEHLFRGCPKCGHEQGGNKLSEKKLYAQETFLEMSYRKHGNRYDYSKAIYTGSKNLVCIVCPKHGEFWQMGGDHISGCGCPSCSLSKGEERIAKWLDNKNIKYIREYKIPNCNLFCSKTFLRVDFYLPDANVFIEYNGEQHYFPVEIFGGEQKFEQQQQRDISLKIYCNRYHIKLIEIPYTEYENIEYILKKKLR